MSQENSSYDMFAEDIELSNEKAKNRRKTLFRIFKALMPQMWKIGIAVSFAIGSVILDLRAPLIFGDAIQELYIGVIPYFMGLGEISINFTALGNIVLLLAGIYIISSLCTYYQERVMADVSQTLVLDLREQVGRKLERVPLKFYDTHKKGEILSRVTNDLERFNEVLSTGIMRLLTSIITLFGAIILMFRIDWVLTTIVLVTLVVGLVMTALVGTKSSEYFSNRQQSMGKFNAAIEEYFSGQVEVKAFNLEKDVTGKTEKAIEQLYKDDKKAQFIQFVIMPVMTLFNQIAYVIIAAVGATFVINGRIPIGRILSFIQYVQMASDPLVEGTFVMNSLNAAIASAERVFELIDEEEDVKDCENPIKLQEPQGEIAFEEVQFGYTKDLLMKGVNFAVQPGQKVAIVGATGAGKTTLINLIMRFYEIQGGAIKVDGVDIRNFKRDYLRSLFGMVLQDSWIFDGTIAENIAYGRPKAKRSEIINAARAARADYFIRTLPKGYDTVMSDENANLSQGEKQLLCIARAILAKPHFLLLDEATSSVDTRTEMHIQKAMDSLMEGRTSFVIAHRLSTIKNADVILVMDKGDIVEVGSHDELMDKGGMYSELYSSQFDATV
jgi:ATP-binding cassette subfamily B protein